MKQLTPDRFFSGFRLGDLQLVSMFFTIMEINEITRDDLEKYIRDLSEREAGRTRFSRIRGVVCPGCGKQMTLYPVNTTRCNQVGGEYQSQWYCRNPNCGASIFNLDTVKEEMMRLIKQGSFDIEKASPQEVKTNLKKRRTNDGTW